MTSFYSRLQVLLLLTGFFYYTVDAQVVINEFSASNKNQHAAANGEFYDWIELYNAGSTAANIGGWHLSDQKGQPTKWVIPAGTSIAAGAHRMFYCSDLNGTVSGQLHTNFKLTQSSDNEEVILSNTAGVIIDSISIPRLQRNHSYGRTSDGAATWSIFRRPTPIPNPSNNAQTANARPAYVPKVQFSLQAGFYTGAQTLTLTCPMPNTTIYYTTNGAWPDSVANANTFLYTGPINLTQTRVVRARAFHNSNQFHGSFTETNTIFINEPVTTFPIWSFASNRLTGTGNFFNTGNETMVSIEYFGADGTRIFQLESDIKRHGNDSWAYDQKGLRIHVRDQYGFANKIDYKIFPTTPRTDFDVVILKAAGSDNFPDGGSNPPNRCAHVRDSYVQSLAEKFNLNVDVRRYKNAIAYINGQYWGVYESRERVDADYTEYYYDNGEKWVDMLEYWGGLTIEEGSDTAWVNLFNFINNNSLVPAANYNYVAARYDVMSLIDYFVLNTYTVNSDWLNWNTAWWRGRKPGSEVKWRYHLWDQDNTFNLGQNFTGLPTTNNNADPCDIQSVNQFATTNNPNIGHVKIFNKLMQNPTFKSLYVNRYADLINTAFYCPNMLTHFDTMIARLAPEMTRHVSRWGSSVAQWNTAVQYTRNQIAGRCNNVVTGLGPCYNVTGPYPVKVNVQPACAGTVKINTITPDQYVFTGNYYGGINVSFKANPATGWQFSHWQLVGHTPSPNVNADSIWLDLGTSGDSIVAVFTQVNPQPGQLTVFIQGTAPGLVTVNGTPVTNGQVVPVGYGTSVNAVATPIQGCTFNRWKLNNTLIYPTDTTESANFCFRKNDTLIAMFDPCSNLPDSLTVLVQQPGWGNVSINGIPVPSYPYTIPVPDGTVLNVSATPTAGYTFSQWVLGNHTLTPNATTPNASFTFNQRDTLIAVFTAPDTFDLVVMVNPLAGGNVTVNGNTPSAYPTTYKFVDGTAINIAAVAAGGYTFSNWTLLNHTLTPGANSPNASFTISANDTLTAFFTAPDTFKLTVLANPLPGGVVSVNGNTISSYPTTLNFVDGTPLNVIATANTGYTFANWTLLNHTLLPNSTSANASFNITSDDTLTAFFNAPDTFNLTVLANPLPGGVVTVNGNAISTYPTTISLVDGTAVNVIATANTGYTFTNWTLPNHSLLPNNTSAIANFTISTNDTLTANFTVNPNPPDTFNLVVIVNPPLSGNVSVNGNTIATYPSLQSYIDGSLLNVAATANTGFAFSNWTLAQHTLNPNANAANAAFVINQPDTLIANFTPVVNMVNLVVQSFPNNGGSVTVNGTTLTTFPTTISLPQNTAVTASSTPNAGFLFNDWHLVFGTLNPASNANPVNFVLTQTDTLYAFYVQAPPDSFNVTVTVKPNVLAGNVAVLGFTPNYYPYTFRFEEGTAVDFSATGNTFTNKAYVFSHYEFIYHSASPNPNVPIVFITVQQPDTVTAFFVEGLVQPDTALAIYIPSGFSPDGDGVNDVFTVRGELLAEFNMQIYNRWGQRVFESNNQGYGWNGTFGEKKCDLGVYTYMLNGKRQNGEDVHLKGTITLLR